MGGTGARLPFLSNMGKAAWILANHVSALGHRHLPLMGTSKLSEMSKERAYNFWICQGLAITNWRSVLKKKDILTDLTEMRDRYLAMKRKQTEKAVKSFSASCT